MAELRDPIHGFIELGKTEIDIINTRVFQRLRKIRQLALANLVYPSANHTRFEHSLGTFHVASKMADILINGQDKDEYRRTVKFAALLHDLGHGPFSHISEYVFNRYSVGRDEEETEEIHEKITWKIIEQNEELARLLSEEERNRIIGVLSGQRIDLTLFKNIVSGPLDADKMDYLLRDSYFCGVKYGVFDLDRILNTLTPVSDNSDQFAGLKSDGINALEQYVLAKYFLTTQVYRHKIRTVTDAMIIRGIELGIEEDGIGFLKNLYTFSEDNYDLGNYIDYWDDKVIQQLVYSRGNGYANTIFRKLHYRDLFKRVFSQRFSEMKMKENIKAKLLDITKKQNRDLRKQIEKEIAGLPEIGTESKYVIVNLFKIKSVKEMSKGSEGEVIIVDKNSDKQTFNERSTVFQSIDEQMKDVYFEVYAPISFSDDRQKYVVLDSLKSDILEIMKSLEV